MQAFRGMFYMGQFAGPTPKRHLIWSNDAVMVNSILEVGGHMTREEMQRCKGAPLVTKYVDKHGVKRHVGNKHVLTASQKLGSVVVMCCRPYRCPWSKCIP